MPTHSSLLAFWIQIKVLLKMQTSELRPPIWLLNRDEKGKTPLCKTTEYGREDNMRLFIEHDERITRDQLMLADNDGMIPLMIAAKNGHVNAMKILLEHYPDEQISFVAASKCTDLFEKFKELNIVS